MPFLFNLLQLDVACELAENGTEENGAQEPSDVESQSNSDLPSRSTTPLTSGESSSPVVEEVSTPSPRVSTPAPTETTSSHTQPGRVMSPLSAPARGVKRKGRSEIDYEAEKLVFLKQMTQKVRGLAEIPDEAESFGRQIMAEICPILIDRHVFLSVKRRIMEIIYDGQETVLGVPVSSGNHLPYITRSMHSMPSPAPFSPRHMPTDALPSPVPSTPRLMCPDFRPESFLQRWQGYNDSSARESP